LTTLKDIPVALDAKALAEKYRIRPGSDQVRQFEELVAEVQEAGRPKALYEVAYIDDKGEDWVSVGGVRLTSRVLRKNLEEAEKLFPYVATCGVEADGLGAAGDDIRRKAWLYLLKGELLEIAVAHVQDHIGRHQQIAKLSSMNPGSGDASVWPLTQQKELFSLLGDVEGRIGVRLTESWLLIPEISVSGVFFPTEADFETCQVCHREHCPSRRAPFSEEAWRALCADEDDGRVETQAEPGGSRGPADPGGRG